jgi:hypothetical protein
MAPGLTAARIDRPLPSTSSTYAFRATRLGGGEDDSERRALRCIIQDGSQGGTNLWLPSCGCHVTGFVATSEGRERHRDGHAAEIESVHWQLSITVSSALPSRLAFARPLPWGARAGCRSSIRDPLAAAVAMRQVIRGSGARSGCTCSPAESCNRGCAATARERVADQDVPGSGFVCLAGSTRALCARCSPASPCPSEAIRIPQALVRCVS